MCAECEYGRMCDRDVPPEWSREKGELVRRTRRATYVITRIGHEGNFSVSKKTPGLNGPRTECLRQTFGFEYFALQAIEKWIEQE